VRLLAFFLTAALWAAGPFQFREVSPASLELTENGKPVFIYNHGLMRKQGVPEDRYRCCYLHPVYSPDGVVLTDDFPSDHYHHRGIFWTWPIVRIDGQQYDAWLIHGIRQKFVRWIARETGAQSARLGVENGWYVGGRKVVRETVEIRVHPAAAGQRQLDFTLHFEALDTPVVLQGEPTQQKGYGGFCVRFAPREATIVTTDKGREARDTNMAPHPWARLDGTFAGHRAGLRIDDNTSNPGYPNGWCLRYYGFLGVNFPGNRAYTLQPGRPLVLKYKVTLFSIP
jgi:hypothetical protein